MSEAQLKEVNTVLAELRIWSECCTTKEREALSAAYIKRWSARAVEVINQLLTPTEN